MERGAQRGHRGVFFLVGDRARDQVITLFNLWQAVRGEGDSPRVLWCYKDELGFSSQQKKRQREVSKLQRQGLYEAAAETPFELFLTATQIRFCYYREAGQVLGSTFDVLVLQDFEGLTANLLCQTVETVRGGGLVFFLLRGLASLRQLFALAMDVHGRYRTERFPELHPLFNERLLLSLCASGAALFLDDELNLLQVAAGAARPAEEAAPARGEQLGDLLLSLAANPSLQAVVALCRTLDQAKVLLALLEALGAQGRPEERRLPTIFLTAGRGRGKSAALGLAVGGALLSGTGNAYVSAANRESAATIFDFAARCLEAAGFKRGLDFVERREAGGAQVELELFVADAQARRLLPVEGRGEGVRRHRLVFLPPEAPLPLVAELLVVDEAAAVPLSLVRPLVAGARCPVLISSTVHGYEGTGRSLSLKLLEELRGESRKLGSARSILELEMTAPIRYAVDDPVEQWLNAFLCLGATTAAPLRRALPPPTTCRLFLVRKETLLSFHRSSERFLAEMWALFVSSHYKNSPNDLQLLSDAPAHFLAVLVGPLTDGLPDILVAAQCAFEGEVGAAHGQSLRGRSFRPAGDLVPWALAEQFLDDQILRFLSVRVVRVATHPKAVKLGYGSQALTALQQFFAGGEPQPPVVDLAQVLACGSGVTDDATEALQPRQGLPPLLKSVEEVRPLRVDYLSVSFGLTRQLFSFWTKNHFRPFHLKQTRNAQTGEFTCMMLRPVSDCGVNFAFFTEDFRRRFARLLGSAFVELEPELALTVLDPPLTTSAAAETASEPSGLLEGFSALDLHRLESYCRNLSEHYLIRDLLPRLAELFFLRCFPAEVTLSYSQALILLGLGLQSRSVEYFAERLRFAPAQVLSLFNKSIRKLYRCLNELHGKRTGEELGFGGDEPENFAEPVGAAIDELGDLAKKKGSLGAKPAKKTKAH